MVSPHTDEPSADGLDAPHDDDARRAMDASTVRLAAKADPDALADVWRQHAPHVVRFLQTQRVQYPEVTASAVWTEVGHSISRFEGDGEALRRWIMQVASSHARAERPEEALGDDNNAAAGTPTNSAHGDSSIADSIAALAMLPPATAEAIMLRHVHGFSIPDIAEITEADPGDVRQLVHSGTKRLHEVLQLEDESGAVVARGTEWTVTNRLRESATPAELRHERREVASFATALAQAPAVVTPPDPQRKRRALAVVAASAVLIGGGIAFTSIVTDGTRTSGLTADPDGPSGEAEIRRLETGGDEQPEIDGDENSPPTDVADDGVTNTDAGPAETDGSDDGESDDSGDTDGGDSSDDTRNDRDGAGSSNTNTNSGSPSASPTPGTAVPAGPPVPVNIPIPATTEAPEPADTSPPTTTRTTTPATSPPTTTRTTTPATSPPTTTRTTAAPTTAAPTTAAPTTAAPTTAAPTTAAPTTAAPTTAAPTTAAPTTAAPTTAPPTAPPTTRPPIVTAPPTTRPPVTNPTASSPPVPGP